MERLMHIQKPLPLSMAQDAWTFKKKRNGNFGQEETPP